MCCNGEYITVDEFYAGLGKKAAKGTTDCGDRIVILNNAIRYLYRFLLQFDNLTCQESITEFIDKGTTSISLDKKIGRIVAFFAKGNGDCMNEQKPCTEGCDDKGCHKYGTLKMHRTKVGLPLLSTMFSYCELDNKVSFNLPNGVKEAWISYIPYPTKITDDNQYIQVPEQYLDILAMITRYMLDFSNVNITNEILSFETKIKEMLQQEAENIKKSYEQEGTFQSNGY